jgi:hypothetical protein
MGEKERALADVVGARRALDRAREGSGRSGSIRSGHRLCRKPRVVATQTRRRSVGEPAVIVGFAVGLWCKSPLRHESFA